MTRDAPLPGYDRASIAGVRGRHVRIPRPSSVWRQGNDIVGAVAAVSHYDAIVATRASALTQVMRERPAGTRMATEPSKI